MPQNKAPERCKNSGAKKGEFSGHVPGKKLECAKSSALKRKKHQFGLPKGFGAQNK
jgi:hypothetical protein